MEWTDLLRTRTASETNQSRLDWTDCGLDRNGTALRGAAEDLDQTRPDQTGLGRTRLDQTGLDQPAAQNGMDLHYVEQ